MINTIIVLAVVLIICFSGVLLFGAPYLPTLKPQVDASFKLANLEPGDVLLELGCGDGRVLIAAAKLGAKSIGYELNPIMAFVAWLRTRRYRKQVKIVCGNFWQLKWPEADVIFVFLLDRYMHKLDTKCTQYPYKPVKLISFAFKIPSRKADKQNKGVYLYEFS
jgi:SAM-dependent methyltransferase